MLHKATVLLCDQLDGPSALPAPKCWRRGAARGTWRRWPSRPGRSLTTAPRQLRGGARHQRASMPLYARANNRSPMRQVVEYSEMITLVNLGRAGEARQRLDQKARPGARGTTLRLQHWGPSSTSAWRRASIASTPTRSQCAIAALRSPAPRPARPDRLGPLAALRPGPRLAPPPRAYDARGHQARARHALLWTWMEATPPKRRDPTLPSATKTSTSSPSTDRPRPTPAKVSFAKTSSGVTARAARTGGLPVARVWWRMTLRLHGKPSTSSSRRRRRRACCQRFEAYAMAVAA